jgi:hypothetical protein
MMDILNYSTMKKTLFAAVAFLAVMAMACQNTGNETNSKETAVETQIKQRVEQMMKMSEVDDADKMLTAELLALQEKAQSVHFWANIFPGFQWDLAVQDACSENRYAKVESVTPVDAQHCDVAMRYIDSTCYTYPYTLKLINENGQWKIDDVLYNESSMRQDCKDFYEDMVEVYATDSPEEIMEFLLGEEPTEANYTDPECLYYNNPEALRHLVETIKTGQALFEKNPGYTEEYGKQLAAMIERIQSHIQ